VRRLVRVLALFALTVVGFPAFAFYGQVVPPSSFQTIDGTPQIVRQGAQYTTRVAGGYVMTEATMSVGARSVTIPVAFRIAGNAAAFAVSKLNPWLMGAQLLAAAIPYVMDWLSRSGNGLEVSPEGVIQVPAQPATAGGAIDYDQTRIEDGRTLRVAFDADAATGNYGFNDPYNQPLQTLSGQDSMCTCVAFWESGYCKSRPAVKIMSRVGNTLRYYCTGNNPIVETEGMPAVGQRHASIDELGALPTTPINPALMPYLDMPIPVDPKPVINPITQPVGDPLVGPDVNPAPELMPSPDPLMYPDGDPVPIPNSSPQQYTQPWYRVQPSPTVSDPWRVDVTQVTTVTNDPSPVPDPTPAPDNSPRPVPDFYTDCDKYPGSLGCMNPGEAPPAEAIPSETRQITMQQGPTFGGGSCPANLTLTIAGTTFTALDMAQPCSWISNLMRPIILLLAAISAVFIVAPRPEG